jgi:transposase
MQIVGALDVHRRQITYKTLDVATGDVRRGRLSPANRESVREWLERFTGCEAEFALEGTTGWRFVAEEIARAGHVAHLADPAETAAKRGSKRRAKTDRADCDLQLKLLLAEELPESWIPPAHILELRARVRTRKTLVEQRSAWQQRLAAQLLHQGVLAGLKPRTRAGREALARVELSPAGRELVAIALRMIDVLDRELVPLDRQLRAFAARQSGCRALTERLYGIGPIAATAIIAELGDCRRFTSSDDAVRHAGLDVTVYQSDGKRAAGHLSHEGTPVLRWALYEAGQQATRRGSPDHDYFLQVRERTDHKSASLSVAPQALPARLPRPARARRAGARPRRPRRARRGGDPRCRLTSRSPCAPARRHEDGCDRLPHKSRRQRRSDLDGLHRPSGRKQHRGGTHPIDHLVAGPRVRAPR